MIKKGDFAVIAFFLVLAAMFWIRIFAFSDAKSEKVLKVYSENKLYAEYDLNGIKKEKNITVKSSKGSIKISFSKDGARAEESDCKDKICIGMGRISKAGQSFVCVPSEIYAEIVSKKESGGVDAVAY